MTELTVELPDELADWLAGVALREHRTPGEVIALLVAELRGRGL